MQLSKRDELEAPDVYHLGISASDSITAAAVAS